MKENTSHIIEGIRAGDQGTFRSLYSNYLKMCGAYVKQNSGSIEDVEDTFQEVLITFSQQVQHNPDLVIYDQAIGSYLYKMTLYKWHEQLRKRKKKPPQDLIIDDPEQQHFLSNKHQDANPYPSIFDLIKEIQEELKKEKNICGEMLQTKIDKDLLLKDFAAEWGFTQGSLRGKMLKCKKLFKERLLQKLNNRNHGK